MSEPKLKLEIDESGRIECRVTNEGVLLSKDEKEFIIDHVMRMQAENAKLRELVRDVYEAAHTLCTAWEGSCSKEFEGMSIHAVCPIGEDSELCVLTQINDRMRELGVEVDE